MSNEVPMSQSLQDIMEECSDAVFVIPNGDAYLQLTLLMEGDNNSIQSIHGENPINKGIIISALHKLMRKNESSYLMYLLGCFFVAVSKHKKENPQEGSYKGVISRIIGRFAIIIFEEGPFLLMDNEAQKKLVNFYVFGRNYKVISYSFLLSLTLNTTMYADCPFDQDRRDAHGIEMDGSCENNAQSNFNRGYL